MKKNIKKLKKERTTQSNMLNDDEKYRSIPRPYILKSISKTNKPRKTNSAISIGKKEKKRKCSKTKIKTIIHKNSVRN